ncbi:hypothetical protein GYMLUDRAFT_221967 [Collybiopsis luxurians FD-317 M1]|uniref:Unplaced genomic scaffold GYMLUscaffold_15, whole genome shotgun sequence n=1 Tax=Collybiopsis luxurians FD-317 M1 TaxID=944289 RepID=A0A0D0C6E2_9AGAR|nr:hypothetical protein GYMLUDRAFT_221967 [Collybiopsis luxurians FD-317 M1]
MVHQPGLRGQNSRVYLEYSDSSEIPPKEDEWTRFICISDTHSGVHWDNGGRMPRGDVLVHAGDLSSWGTVKQLKKTIDWLASLEGYGSKVLIAGNHDLWLDKRNLELAQLDREERTAGLRACEQLMAKAHLDAKRLTYLQFEETGVQVDKKEWAVYGSPASPRHYMGAFQYETLKEAEEINSRIPSSTEILITHTPPYGTLDKTRKGKHAGCRNLAERLVSEQLKNCRLHVFGHIHEAAGAVIIQNGEEGKERVAVNAAMIHRGYPIVVDLKNEPEFS